MLQNASKIQLWGPSWPKLAQLGPNMGQLGANMAHLGPNLAELASNLGQLGANLDPSSLQDASRRRKNGGNLGVKKQLLTRPPPKLPQETILGPILEDFGSHFGRFLEQFWWILGPMLEDFWNNFGWFFIHFWHLSHHMKTPPRDEFGTNFDGFWKPFGRIFWSNLVFFCRCLAHVEPY